MNTNSIYKSTASQEEILALYDKVLSQWPVPNQHIHLPTRYGDSFVIASGDASAAPMVLLHGTASNSATWAQDVIEYSQHYRVYATDMPGEPGKSDPNCFSWEGPAFVEWLDDVLDGLKLDKAILVGMSLGGWAAVKYAIHKPERVDTAVLICPSGIYPPRLSFVVRVVGYSMLGEWGRDRMKKYIFKGAPLSEDADQFLTLVNENFNYRAGSPPLFTDEQLQGLTMPVLFLAGEKDVLLNTPKTAERLQKLVPNLTTNIIEEDGHAAVNMAPEVMAYLTDQGRVQTQSKPYLKQAIT